MRILLVVIPFILLTATVVTAQSSDDCMLDLKGLKSPIVFDGRSMKTLQAPKLNTEKRSISHIVLLSSGTKVEYTAGGCVHYGFTYTFSQLKEIPSEKGELFDFIREQFRQLQLKDFITADLVKDTLDALEKASATPENWETPTDLMASFRDANTFLKIEKGAFSVTYDFPL